MSNPSPSSTVESKCDKELTLFSPCHKNNNNNNKNKKNKNPHQNLPEQSVLQTWNFEQRFNSQICFRSSRMLPTSHKWEIFGAWWQSLQLYLMWVAALGWWRGTTSEDLFTTSHELLCDVVIIIMAAVPCLLVIYFTQLNLCLRWGLLGGGGDGNCSLFLVSCLVSIFIQVLSKRVRWCNHKISFSAFLLVYAGARILDLFNVVLS